MERKDIKTLDDALKFIDQVIAERDEAVQRQQDAEAVADDAIAKASAAIAAAPKDYTTKIIGTGKVKVFFGVDGLTKDQLLDNSDKIVELIKKGSHAVQVVEPENQEG
jgi:hypothetical protein